MVRAVATRYAAVGNAAGHDTMVDDFETMVDDFETGQDSTGVDDMSPFTH
jgi:hypothetical protein